MHGVSLAESSPRVVRVIRGNNLGDKLYHRRNSANVQAFSRPFFPKNWTLSMTNAPLVR